VSSPPLIDIVGKQNELGDRCVDILVEKTRLSLSAGFVAAVARFIAESLPERVEVGCDNLGYVGDPMSKMVIGIPVIFHTSRLCQYFNHF